MTAHKVFDTSHSQFDRPLYSNFLEFLTREKWILRVWKETRWKGNYSVVFRVYDLEPVWYVCLKIENCCLKKFVEIRVGEKVCWNAWNVV